MKSASVRGPDEFYSECCKSKEQIVNLLHDIVTSLGGVARNASDSRTKIFKKIDTCLVFHIYTLSNSKQI